MRRKLQSLTTCAYRSLQYMDAVPLCATLRALAQLKQFPLAPHTSISLDAVNASVELSSAQILCCMTSLRILGLSREVVVTHLLKQFLRRGNACFSVFVRCLEEMLSSEGSSPCFLWCVLAAADFLPLDGSHCAEGDNGEDDDIFCECLQTFDRCDDVSAAERLLVLLPQIAAVQRASQVHLEQESTCYAPVVPPNAGSSSSVFIVSPWGHQQEQSQLQVEGRFHVLPQPVWLRLIRCLGRVSLKAIIALHALPRPFGLWLQPCIATQLWGALMARIESEIVSPRRVDVADLVVLLDIAHDVALCAAPRLQPAASPRVDVGHSARVSKQHVDTIPAASTFANGLTATSPPHPDNNGGLRSDVDRLCILAKDVVVAGSPLLSQFRLFQLLQQSAAVSSLRLFFTVDDAISLSLCLEEPTLRIVHLVQFAVSLISTEDVVAPRAELDTLLRQCYSEAARLQLCTALVSLTLEQLSRFLASVARLLRYLRDFSEAIPQGLDLAHEVVGAVLANVDVPHFHSTPAEWVTVTLFLQEFPEHRKQTALGTQYCHAPAALVAEVVGRHHAQCPTSERLARADLPTDLRGVLRQILATPSALLLLAENIEQHTLQEVLCVVEALADSDMSRDSNNFAFVEPLLEKILIYIVVHSPSPQQCRESALLSVAESGSLQTAATRAHLYAASNSGGIDFPLLSLDSLTIEKVVPRYFQRLRWFYRPDELQRCVLAMYRIAVLQPAEQHRILVSKPSWIELIRKYQMLHEGNNTLQTKQTLVHCFEKLAWSGKRN